MKLLLIPYEEWVDLDGCDHSNPYEYSAFQRRLFEKTTSIRYLADCIGMNIRSAYCKRFGHDWEHWSAVGPDNGSEGGECRRCYYSWDHTYY